MTLRPFQQDCLDKLLWAGNQPGNDLIQIAQGGGKSHVLAEYAKAINEDVLILQPSRELLIQNRSKLLECVPAGQIGIYSASLLSKKVSKYTFATIGSCFRKPQEFSHFKTVIIDEAHLLNVKRQGSMLTSFLKAIGSPKTIGLTATPFRQVQQYIRHSAWYVEAVTMTKMLNRMLPKFWDRLLYTISTQELIAQGYLVPLTYVDKKLIDQMEIPINKSKSDFDMEKFEDKIWGSVNQIVATIKKAADHFNSILVFCSSIGAADALKLYLDGEDVEVVTSKTVKKERARIVNGFKEGKIKIVLNVGILTTGFDHPALDCIVLLRPCRSIGLYLQMLGRGSRIAPGKKTCYVVDFTDTVNKLGKIETFKIAKNDGLWDIQSEQGWWHKKPLYSFPIDIMRNS